MSSKDLDSLNSKSKVGKKLCKDGPQENMSTKLTLYLVIYKGTYKKLPSLHPTRARLEILEGLLKVKGPIAMDRDIEGDHPWPHMKRCALKANSQILLHT